MPSTRLPGRALVAFALTLVLAAPAFGQQGIVQTGTPAETPTTKADPKVKRSLSIADYSRWRSIDGAQICT